MSTISPLRASITAQKRALRDSTAARYTTIPPKTADVDSPNPNEEASEPAARDSNLGFKTKLDILLKHNSQLLNENAQLSEMVNSLRADLEIRTRREETEFTKLNQEMGAVMV